MRMPLLCHACSLLELGALLQLCYAVAGARLVTTAGQFERLGLAPLDAIACGTPVVAVHEGGFFETMVDGVTGFLLDRDAQSVSDAMQRLLDNPRLAADMCQQGGRMVEQRWTWKTAVDHLEEHFHEIGQVSR